ncbi:MAG TPA: DUF6456 domain-containing protein [Rhizomicrobium sp.]|nr:DUF6456 domain-containing protein [Rhizomicrobium sp.]
MIAEGEVQREARRVLRALLAEGAALERAADGAFTLTVAGKPGRSRLRVRPEHVAGFRTRDWIAPRGTKPESFVLGEAGAAWLARTQADGDPFAAQHRIAGRRFVVDAEGRERVVQTNDGESPLSRLKARKLIGPAQWEAGERLRRDFTLAQLAPRLGVDLAAPMAPGRRGAREATLTETVVAARQRFARAMAAVGPGLNDLLFDICCHLKGLEEAERAFGWPSRAAKVVLSLALDRLALHYGLIVIAPSRARMRGWRLE